MNIHCGGGAEAARQAHNLEVGGASPSHATNSLSILRRLAEGDCGRVRKYAAVSLIVDFPRLGRSSAKAPAFFNHSHTDYP